MGRYYSGNIEGKFWFGTQNSDAAEQFGAVANEPNYINYLADNSEVCKTRIKELLAEIGVNHDDECEAIINHHKEINDNDSPTNDQSKSSIDIPFIQQYTKKKLWDGLQWNKYDSQLADLELGFKIYWCIIDKGECYFEAEL
jgi:hypothetical protein